MGLNIHKCQEKLRIEDNDHHRWHYSRQRLLDVNMTPSGNGSLGNLSTRARSRLGFCMESSWLQVDFFIQNSSWLRALLSIIVDLHPGLVYIRNVSRIFFEGERVLIFWISFPITNLWVFKKWGEGVWTPKLRVINP